jgi:broad specificity phosphatase PhoE
MSRPGPYRLVVLRHGQSEWNAAGLFTGWENAHLTAHGDLLRRTIRTTDLALSSHSEATRCMPWSSPFQEAQFPGPGDCLAA